MTGRIWRQPPLDPQLPSGEIHIWRAPLLAPIRPQAELFAWLTPDEQERAGRFHFERDRRRYTIARATLRYLLGRYLDASPSAIRLDYGPQGKPQLAGKQLLVFNLAHSHELAVYAFSRHGLIGIDVEYSRWVREVADLAERFFARPEYEAWLALPDTDRRVGFFRIWSRKEAFIKALGDGLSHPLGQFVVSVDPAQPAHLISIAGDEDRVGGWFLHDIDPGTGYLGAVAATGSMEPRAWSLRWWEVAG